ncbi:hypothetical protein [Aminipila terrae]|uniref:Uncharacterized protein n=1 Tax=Aminipila terrae TaxID=2697030 RepID=A0A6P1MFA6_9FIRM|nr:hypothetical protein [Aminipila terrae]QHI72587.1 hypothetical protein Ami3637_09415 [Aminipila terrae]
MLYTVLNIEESLPEIAGYVFGQEIIKKYSNTGNYNFAGVNLIFRDEMQQKAPGVSEASGKVQDVSQNIQLVLQFFMQLLTDKVCEEKTIVNSIENNLRIIGLRDVFNFNKLNRIKNEIISLSAEQNQIQKHEEKKLLQRLEQKRREVITLLNIYKRVEERKLLEEKQKNLFHAKTIIQKQNEKLWYKDSKYINENLSKDFKLITMPLKVYQNFIIHNKNYDEQRNNTEINNEYKESAKYPVNRFHIGNTTNLLNHDGKSTISNILNGFTNNPVNNFLWVKPRLINEEGYTYLTDKNQNFNDFSDLEYKNFITTLNKYVNETDNPINIFNTQIKKVQNQINAIEKQINYADVGKLGNQIWSTGNYNQERLENHFIKNVEGPVSLMNQSMRYTDGQTSTIDNQFSQVNEKVNGQVSHFNNQTRDIQNQIGLIKKTINQAININRNIRYNADTDYSLINTVSPLTGIIDGRRWNIGEFTTIKNEYNQANLVNRSIKNADRQTNDIHNQFSQVDERVNGQASHFSNKTRNIENQIDLINKTINEVINENIKKTINNNADTDYSQVNIENHFMKNEENRASMINKYIKNTDGRTSNINNQLNLIKEESNKQINHANNQIGNNIKNQIGLTNRTINQVINNKINKTINRNTDTNYNRVNQINIENTFQGKAGNQPGLEKKHIRIADIQTANINNQMNQLRQKTYDKINFANNQISNVYNQAHYIHNRISQNMVNQKSNPMAGYLNHSIPDGEKQIHSADYIVEKNQLLNIPAFIFKNEIPPKSTSPKGTQSTGESKENYELRQIKADSNRNHSEAEKQRQMISELKEKLESQQLMIKQMKSRAEQEEGTIKPSEIAKIKKEVINSVSKELKLEKQRRGLM